jgi:hypothetical protein
MGGGGGGPNRNPNFDGGGMRPRGNAQQLMEKFLAMARDASAMGDRVAAENYFQHADHYYRVLNARFEAQQQQQQNGYNNGQQRHNNQGPRGYDRNDQGDEHQGNNGQEFNRQQGANNFGGQSYQQEAHGHDQQPSSEGFRPQPAYQPQPQPVAAPVESDIGLPPGILGAAPVATPQAQDETDQDEGREAPAENRPPRRRRGRGHGGQRPAQDS